ncbi:MAG: diguanylate cyclase [Pseudomonadales bacterium]|nr:diguanylate cyclase [Pseudomonadales bacterium]
MSELDSHELLEFIVDRVNVGLFIVDSEMNVVLWNRFMEINSRVTGDEILGKNIFDTFGFLPRRWLEKKIQSVFMIKGFSFVSWEQRPYLFEFPHNRPITGGVEFMYQDLVLMPVRGESGEVEKVCIALHDVTDVGYYQTELKRANEELEKLSRIDGLTQLANRRHWEERLSEEYSRAKRYDETVSLIMFDLDKFKNINDTHGHLAGDEILRTVSSNVKEILRESDVAGRYGGEEFGIILPNTDIKGAVIVGEKLRKLVEETKVIFEGVDIPFAISGGVVEFNDSHARYEDLISNADEALYYSKEHGRNQFNSFPLPD